MKNKSSLGIKIFGILAIILSLTWAFAAISLFKAALSYMSISELLHSNVLFTGAHLIIFPFCWLFFGIGVLRLLNWARIGLITTAVVDISRSFFFSQHTAKAILNKDLFFLSFMTIYTIFYCFLIYFFTRPKVKEQFKE